MDREFVAVNFSDYTKLRDFAEYLAGALDDSCGCGGPSGDYCRACRALDAYEVVKPFLDNVSTYVMGGQK